MYIYLYIYIYIKCNKNLLRSCSHAFFRTYDRTLAKKLLAVHPEKVTRRKKRKKTREAIAKLFTLSINAIMNNMLQTKTLTQC